MFKYIGIVGLLVATTACSSSDKYSHSYNVKGKKYSVLKTSHKFEQKGVSSWYGKPFHGRKAANGRTYNMYELSAAHKSLPLGTLVKVTNLENNKSIVVEITDRGPFKGDRVLDLSYGAAKKLGFVNQGLTDVKIIAL